MDVSSPWETSLRPPEASGGDAATLSSESYQFWLQTDPEDTQDAVTASRKCNKQRTSRSAKKRKSTYDIRREQKVELTAQAETLQKQLDELKYRVLVEQGEAAKSNERVAAGNTVLQEFIQQQHLQLANMQAMLAGHLQQNVDSLHPAQTIIRLGTDPIERYNVLVALKDKKLQEAKQFISTRSQGVDPRSSYSQEERNNDGDFCHVIFENKTIQGASAREVFEAFIDVAQNAEIIISEMFGSITIRENTEADTRDISQGTLVESNTVMFAEFVEAKDEQEESCGVIVADFVDSDELYPYKPEEREKHKASDDQELLVVATRWSCSKIRRSGMNLSADECENC
ncbi:hypothetical protein GQ600_141 [Phytophthora cactorum]|nr:hypothetical protein GQ600_141 [Phytophthora cactorum]